MRICSLTYPAFKAQAPFYIVICSLSGFTIFFNYLINGMILGEKKLLKIKLVF